MRFYLLLSGLLVVLAFLQFRLWFEQDGIRDMLHMRAAMALQVIESDKLKKQNEELAFQVRRMQNSNEATESRARSELGMIKQNEKFYQIVKKTETKDAR